MSKIFSIQSKFTKLLGGLFLLFIGMAIVLSIAYLPLGYVARMAILAIATFGLVLVWGMRNNKNQAPESFIFGLMMLIVLLSVAWPRYLFFSLGALPKVNPQTLTIMVGLVFVILFMVYSPQFSKRVITTFKKGGALFTLIITWFLWRFFANFLGTEPMFSTLDFLREMLYLATFILFGSVIASYENGPQKMIKLVLLAAFLIGLTGIAEAFQQKNIFVGLIPNDIDGELSKILTSIASDKTRGGGYRVQSVFSHPIVFAQFFSAIIPLAIYGFFSEKKWIWRILSMLLIPIAILCILKSGSRSGLIGFAVAMVCLSFLFWLRALVHGRISRFIAMLLVPLIAIAVSFFYFVLQDLVLVGQNREESGSTQIRMLMINNGIDALSSSPIWGFGQSMALGKAGILNTKGLATIDNYLLNIALDSGYFGLAIFVLLILTFAYKSLKFAVVDKGKNWLLVGACASGVFALISIFTIVSIVDNMTFLWILILCTFPYIGNKVVIERKVGLPIRSDLN